MATADRHIQVYDIHNLQNGPIESRESPLKYQTRKVSCFLDGSAFALGSVEVSKLNVCSLGGIFYEWFNMLCRVESQWNTSMTLFRIAWDQQDQDTPSNVIAAVN